MGAAGAGADAAGRPVRRFPPNVGGAPMTDDANEVRPMATQSELLEAISDRLLEHLAQGSTSDSILKLAEAWAWVHSPDQAHGSPAAR